MTDDMKENRLLDVSENPMKELFEQDEVITSNAMVAVQGFTTHDDDNRCKHYDPKTGGCFKGGRCKLIHVGELNEGEFRDKKRAFVYNDNSSPVPKLGFHYSIKITDFVSVNRFLCHFQDVKEFYYGKSLSALRQEINDEKNIKTYRSLPVLPAPSELVMVKHEKTFYRGKVLDSCDELLCVTVLLVDEGKIIEKVHYKCLYEFCSRFSNYPFFAIEMKLANAKLIDGYFEGIDYLMDLQEKTKISIVPVQIVPEILCELYDSTNMNIGELLIKKGFAIPQQIPLINNEDLKSDTMVIMPA